MAFRSLDATACCSALFSIGSELRKVLFSRFTKSKFPIQRSSKLFESIKGSVDADSLVIDMLDRIESEVIADRGKTLIKN